ncbi:NAD(P)-binding domain-containing protein, partial [Vibrio breoganii]
LNMNDHGFKVVAHNRTAAKVDEFLEGPAKGTNIVGAYSLEELVEKLEAPRKVMLMVRAGDVVDTFIENLIPLLDEGDIIIDGGNTNYPDTNRRVAHCREKGIHFIGTG